jgi:hypothetical protein
MSIEFRRKMMAAVSIAGVTLSRVAATQAPPVRPLGPIVAITSEPLTSVSQVKEMSRGRVIVNDNAARRLLMFDSTLKLVNVIADSTSGASNAYGPTIGGLVGYRGDSILFVEPASLAMLVLDAAGAIVRTMAAPRDAPVMVGGPFGTPGLDGHNRLVYRMLVRPESAPTMISRGLRPCQPDSALIVRLDLTSRVTDTVAKIGIPQVCLNYTRNDKGQLNFSLVVNPAPWTDDWALLADGTIAIVRGRAFRVEFLHPDGTVRSSPPIPFEWHRMADEEKRTLIDSTRAEADKTRAAQLERGAPAPVVELVGIGDLPDYRPAIQQGSVLGDADGNLWIRTTARANGSTIYYVLNSSGSLTRRISMPPGRVIAGFGANGIVYMGVVDGSTVRLERAHIR